MKDIGKLYEEYSSPLNEAKEYINDRLYFDPDGNAWKYTGNNEFEFQYGSLLVEKELLISLTKTQLDLFWRIHKNRINSKKVY